MEKLKEYRERYQYSLEDMANKLGICKTFYWQLENEKRRLNYEMAIQIAAIFNKKPDDLFYDDLKEKNYQKRVK